jgi:hypothetical protein
MLGHGNNTVPVDRNLFAEIEYANQLRAFERGLSRVRPDPRETDKFTYIPTEESKSALNASIEEALNMRRMQEEQSVVINPKK